MFLIITCKKGNNISPFGSGDELCVLSFEYDLFKFHVYDSVFDKHSMMVLCNVDIRYCGWIVSLLTLFICTLSAIFI